MNKTLLIIALFFYPLNAQAALIFGANVSDRVDVGAANSLVNLQPWTLCTWMNVTSQVDSRIYAKGNTFPNRQFAQITTVNINLTTAMSVSSASASAALANFTSYALNKWVFFCGNEDNTVVGNNLLWMGDLTTSIAQPSAYVAQSLGSGSQGNTSGINSIIGNDNGNAVAFNGSIAWIGIWNRLLTQAEMESLRLNPRRLPGNKFFKWLGYAQGIGTQIDKSGFRNNGTVTGATSDSNPDFVSSKINGTTKINGTVKIN